MSFGEAFRLTVQLVRDPSSAVGAAVAGWDYPTTHAALILADLFDLHHTVNTKQRPAPHPLRPFSLTDQSRRRVGNVGGRTTGQVVTILADARAGRYR